MMLDGPFSNDFRDIIRIRLFRVANILIQLDEIVSPEFQWLNLIG